MIGYPGACQAVELLEAVSCWFVFAAAVFLPSCRSSGAELVCSVDEQVLPGSRGQGLA